VTQPGVEKSVLHSSITVLFPLTHMGTWSSDLAKPYLVIGTESGVDGAVSVGGNQVDLGWMQ
jgi:hypothetical protein